MEISTRSLEYITLCLIVIVVSWIFREEEIEEITYHQPEISEQQFDSHPIIAWPAVDNRGNVYKIKYRVTNHNTKLWIYDVETGNLIHEQPYTRDPSIQDGSYRDFIYTWKLYKTEWTVDVPKGIYEIVVGGDIEPYSIKGKLTTTIDLN